MNVRQLYKVPVPSTSFEDDAHLCMNTIFFQYYRDGVLYRSGIRFNSVPATRTRAERCSTASQIDGAYDTLVEIQDSPWVEEMRSDMNFLWRDKWQMHHFAIYLDSVGYFEVIAESWEVIPEEPGTWDLDRYHQWGRS